jgi:hypothetical protein
MTPGSTVTLIAEGPDRARRRIALMKHAYLAYCIAFGTSDNEVLAQVRSDLIRARNASRREEVQPSPSADALLVLRSPAPHAKLSSITTATVQHPDGSFDGVILAGRVFVSWPTSMGPSRRPPELRTERTMVELAIGHPIGGVIE